MMIPVTLVAAGVLCVMFVGLSFFVVKGRMKTLTALGDGGHELMQRRIRAQGNFAEYVPLALIVMGLLEMYGGNPTLLAILAVLLVIGRVLHAYSLLRSEPAGRGMRGRQVGMMLTFGVLGVMGVWAVGMGLSF